MNMTGRALGPKALAIIAALILAACTTLHPRAPIARPSTRVPVTAPASGIAVLEPGSYEPEKNRIKSRLAGSERDSLAPAEVGYYMDVLQGRMKQIASSGMSVVRRGDGIAVDLMIRNGFKADNSQVSPGMREIMAPLSKALAEYRKTLLSVRIRPENAGAATSDPGLAEQRATAVARCLLDGGIGGKRIVVLGTGTDRVPAAKTAAETPVRIELQIEPIVRTPESKR